ncbi:hypothetical protein D3C71_2202920 [compost metagenome]
MLLTLTSDGDLFTAALSQSTVTVWQTDAKGVYCEVDRGIIDQFNRTAIRMITNTDEIAFYFRDDGTLFRVET